MTLKFLEEVFIKSCFSMSSHGIATLIVGFLDFKNHILMSFFDNFYNFSHYFHIVNFFLYNFEFLFLFFNRIRIFSLFKTKAT